MHGSRSQSRPRSPDRLMERAPECLTRCQYALDVSMPEHHCARECRAQIAHVNTAHQPSSNVNETAAKAGTDSE
jgi:hypothetical protein